MKTRTQQAAKPPKPIDLLFLPRTDSQRDARVRYHENDVNFLVGPAGTGKTTVGVSLALQDVLDGKKRKLLLCRPQVEFNGEKMGYLPGDLNEKMLPWLYPIYDVLEGVTNTKPETIFREFVEVIPLGMMQGRTFRNSIAIIDECQNLTYSGLKMILTRLGPNSKIVFCGDPDNNQTVIRDSGLLDIMNRLDGLEGVGITMFPRSDIVRHPLIERMLERL